MEEIDIMSIKFISFKIDSQRSRDHEKAQASQYRPIH
jgi:hypothetical protein